ncbi:hypothetical protein SAMD00024442_10_26 [Candidatus Symbiothrix dinenymphae]|nr:hypothetical protein SAMD00024442_10_26 [Candidatus Symbiothrix dinenymphae]
MKTIVFSKWGRRGKPAVAVLVGALWLSASVGSHVAAQSYTLTLQSSSNAPNVTLRAHSNSLSGSPLIVPPATSGNISVGTDVYLTTGGAISGYTFLTWTVVSGGANIVAPNQSMGAHFIMPADNVVILANLTPILYAMSYQRGTADPASGPAVMPWIDYKTHGTAYTGLLASPTNLTPPLTKVGYTFAGWGNTGGTAQVNWTADSPQDFYPLWTARRHTINRAVNVNPPLSILNTNPAHPAYTNPANTNVDAWSLQGKTGTNHASNQPNTDAKVYLSAANITGFNFLYWTVDGGATVLPTPTQQTDAYFLVPAGSGTTDVNVTANYAPVEYTITYERGNADPGSGPASMPVYDSKYHDVNYFIRGKGSPANFTSSPLTRVGYNFTGWTTTFGGATAHNPNTAWTTNANATFYPHWTARTNYTLNFDVDGGTGGGFSGMTGLTYDAPITLPSATLQKPGCSFVGWEHPNGTFYAPNASYTVLGSFTLKARWDYVVAYNGNYHASASPTTETLARSADAGGSTATLNNGLSADSTYTILGWYDASGNLLALGDVYKPTNVTAPIQAYVRTQATVKKDRITFEGNGSDAGTPPSDVFVARGQAYTNVGPTNNPNGLSRAGYSFLGWSPAFDDSVSVSIPATHNVDPQILYAVWKPLRYRITYIVGANTTPALSGDSITHNGTQITIRPAPPAPINMTFDTWNTVPNGTGVNYAPGDPYTTNANLTLYAVWKPVAYTIQYNLNNGNVGGGLPVNSLSTTGNKVHGAYYTFAGDPGWNRPGFWQDGWSFSNVSGTPKQYDFGAVDMLTYYDINLPPSGIHTVYAHWTPELHKARTILGQFASGTSTIDGGSEVDKINGVGSNVVAGPADVGYLFSHWTVKNFTGENPLLSPLDSGSFSNRYAASTVYTIGQRNVEVQAVYKPVTQTISFTASMPAYTISVGGVSPTLTYPGTAGQTLQLECPTPAATDTFLGWSYNAGHIPPNQIYSLTATYTIGTTGATVIARYGPRSAMTVVVSPPQAAVANTGMVDGTTSATKAGGTEVQLTRPTASDPGYQFDSWAVNGPSYGSFILHPGTALPDSFRFAPGNVTGNITAHFKMRLRRGPAVTGGQIDPLLARDVYYSLGAVVNVTAYPASGYRFDQWTHGAGGAVLGTTNPLTVTIADTIVCVAEYVKTWTLTTGVNNLSGGSVAVTTAPSPLSAPNYDNGAAIAVEATANSGWRFSHWANGGTTVGTLPTYSTTINSDLTLTAHFEHIYKATVEVYPPGSGVAGALLTGAPDTILATATTYAIANIFTAAPNAGYHFLNQWNNATLGLVGISGFTPSTSYPTQAIQAVFEEDHKITPRVMNSADGLPHGTVQSGGATVAGPGLSTTATFNHNPPPHCIYFYC